MDIGTLMNKELVTTAEARRRFYAGPLFDQIARGFLNTMATHQEGGEVSDCLNYLDDAVKIDGAWYPRRAVVLAIEDLKQRIDAPLALQIEARAQMNLLKFDPITELKLYRDIATAILRMDAALRLHQVEPSQYSSGRCFQ